MPTTKVAAVSRMSRLRPSRSDNRPARKAPTAAPSSSDEVMTPLRKGVLQSKSLAISGSAPPMTPVS